MRNKIPATSSLIIKHPLKDTDTRPKTSVRMLAEVDEAFRENVVSSFFVAGVPW